MKAFVFVVAFVVAIIKIRSFILALMYWTATVTLSIIVVFVTSHEQ